MIRDNKILIAAVAMVGALAAFWFLALAPKREQAARLDEQVAVKQAELANAQTTLAGYQKARAAYPRNYATLVRLGKAVPDDDDVRSLLVQLDDATGGSGVDFRTVTVGGATGAPSATASTPQEPLPPGAVSVGSTGVAAMPFSFSFTGSFENLSGFFSRLERFVTLRNERLNVTGRLLRLETIDLKLDAAGFPQLRAEIGASSYLVSAATDPAAGATAQGPAGATPAGTPAPAGGPAPPTTTATVTGATP